MVDDESFEKRQSRQGGTKSIPIFNNQNFNILFRIGVRSVSGIWSSSFQSLRLYQYPSTVGDLLVLYEFLLLCYSAEYKSQKELAN
jgi:hypothetical protein